MLNFYCVCRPHAFAVGPLVFGMLIIIAFLRFIEIDNLWPPLYNNRATSRFRFDDSLEFSCRLVVEFECVVLLQVIGSGTD